MTVDAISAVFDGNGTAASATGNHCDGFAAVAAQGEEKCVEFGVAGINGLNRIFFAKLGFAQCHKITWFQ